MSNTVPAARTSAFAHLLSSAAALGSRVTGARAENNEDDEDDEARKARRAEENDLREQEDARRAEEDERRKDEDAKRAEEDGTTADDTDGDADKGKKAEEPDDDEKAENLAECDDDDEEMAKARREGFRAAQARGRRIFGAASAGVRPDVAAHLVLNENRPSAQAIAMLDMVASGTAPVEAGSRLARRMARVDIPNPGAGGGSKKPEDLSFGELAKAAAVKAGIISA